MAVLWVVITRFKQALGWNSCNFVVLSRSPAISVIVPVARIRPSPLVWPWPFFWSRPSNIPRFLWTWRPWPPMTPWLYRTWWPWSAMTPWPLWTGWPRPTIISRFLRTSRPLLKYENKRSCTLIACLTQLTILFNFFNPIPRVLFH
jgi:hypothetical protein